MIKAELLVCRLSAGKKTEKSSVRMVPVDPRQFSEKTSLMKDDVINFLVLLY